MLRIISKPEELPYSDLMCVYEQSNREKAIINFPQFDGQAGLLCAEQELYQYLSAALENKTAIIVLWVVHDRCCSALRLEQYCDGFLLTSLETAPEERRKGYALELVRAVLSAFSNHRIYSHIFNSNSASVILHEKCGFRKILNHAQMLDGSISYDACTYLHENEQPAQF